MTRRVVVVAVTGGGEVAAGRVQELSLASERKARAR